MSIQKVLIACTRKDTYQIIEEVFKEQSAGRDLRIVLALDGADFLFRLSQSQFDLFVIEEGLLKVPSEEAWARFRASEGLVEVPLIWIGQEPPEEQFFEELYQKKTYTCTRPLVKEKFAAALSSANGFQTSSQAEFEIRSVVKGEVVIAANAEPKFVYILKSGCISIYMPSGSERTKVLELTPGDFIGEMNYYSEVTRAMEVVADSPCELIAIPVDQFETRVANRPTWQRALLKILARRLQALNLFLIQQKMAA